MLCHQSSLRLNRCIHASNGSTVLFASFRCFVSSGAMQMQKEPQANICQPITTCTRTEIMNFQNKTFDDIRKQQLTKLVPRIEKIEIKYKGRGISDSAVMYMNKHLSTPHHCALHISKTVADSAVLALVTPNDENNSLLQAKPHSGKEVLAKDDTEPQPIPWDMHRPLPFNCKLEILNFNMPQSTQWHHDLVNKIYWQSCAMILGAVIQEAFKENYSIGLYKLPHISVNRGAFCYDVITEESLRDWKPQERDLIFLTKIARSIISKNLKFERLEVDRESAIKMFNNNRFQLDRISNILRDKKEDAKISLYRFGQYIDISNGPHISNTSHIYHYVVTAVHKLKFEEDADMCPWRIQALSLPQNLKVHHAVWSMLENRARKLVKENLPHPPVGNDEAQSYVMSGSIENETKEYMKSTGQWREGIWKKTEDVLKPTIEP
ncbi:unnamed protein product [Clavelina lepadiformis]|uniref:Uncharacterized protein n=1 Tax=Clavelina lepadiformis TaxID=159417 RepID=A0ABP0GL80_CLALP